MAKREVPGRREKANLECDKLPKRLRAICNGTSGLPPWKEEQYRRRWQGKPVPQKPPKRSRGLGDTVAKVFKALGFSHQCAGCGRRQSLLNRLVPYRRK